MGPRENEICQISQNYNLHMKFSKFYLCIQNSSEILAFIFSDSHYRVSLVLLQMTKLHLSPLKKVKKNTVFFKLFWYKVFVH